jgi:hypothetical protein
VNNQPMIEEGDAIGAKVIAVTGGNGREGGGCPEGARGREGEVG